MDDVHTADDLGRRPLCRRALTNDLAPRRSCRGWRRSRRADLRSSRGWRRRSLKIGCGGSGNTPACRPDWLHTIMNFFHSARSGAARLGDTPQESQTSRTRSTKLPHQDPPQPDRATHPADHAGQMSIRPVRPGTSPGCGRAAGGAALRGPRRAKVRPGAAPRGTATRQGPGGQIRETAPALPTPLHDAGAAGERQAATATSAPRTPTCRRRGATA